MSPFSFALPSISDSTSFPGLVSTTNLAASLKASAVPPLNATQAQVAVIGAVVIESLTILASIYLLIPLSKQGFAKVRVKLLYGMVLSDLMLGLVGIVPNIAFLAGHKLIVGRPTCNATGFLLTTVLFTQHLWTLSLATATYLILKRPLSIWTRRMEDYWYAFPTFIWGASILQAALWYHINGMSVSTSGALCYYGPGKHALDRDLVQFVPRAFVFAVVIILYSGLFKFLRRPDTVHAPSSIDDTFDSPSMIHSFPGGRRGTDISFAFKGGAMDEQAAEDGERLSGVRPTIHRKTSAGFVKWPSQIKMKDIGETNSTIPPWEQLHLNKVDLPDTPMELPPATALWRERQESKTSTLLESSGTQSSESSTLPPSRSHPRLADRPSLSSLTDNGTRKGSEPSLSNGSIDPKSRLFAPAHHRASTTSLSESGHSMADEFPGSRAEPLAYHDDEGGRVLLEGQRGPEPAGSRSAFTKRAFVRRGSVMDELNGDDDDDRDHNGAQRPRRQTLQEFFAQHQATFADLDEKSEGPDANRTTRRRSSDNSVSAATYFNRQASLLMLYFPLAYLVLFSFSLVRLLYDMITEKNSAVLTILSLWFTLSVGLVDALVYGLAEYIVKRRVRRKMPSNFRPVDPGE